MALDPDAVRALELPGLKSAPAYAPETMGLTLDLCLCGLIFDVGILFP